MKKKLKIFILMGMTIGVLTYIGFNKESKKTDVLSQKESDIIVECNKETNTPDIRQENTEKKIEPIDIESTIGENYYYEISGDRTLCNNVLFKDVYTNLEGIIGFRGGNFRNTASYGISNISSKKLSVKWKFTTSFSTWGGGAGWTGQPSIIKWNDNLKKSMNIKDKYKNKEDFTEVIYASLDGNIYFLDLDSGDESRRKINVGNPIKGSLAIDSRGLPLLYVGEGINESGVTGFNIYSLIDGSSLYEINGMDEFAHRGWPAFDGSALIYSEGDIVIEGGENGLLYAMKLNTDYNKEENTLSINPEITKYRYSTSNNSGRLGIENSVAAYANLLYFADNNGDIQCIDVRSMEPKWLLSGNDDTDASITIDDEDGTPYLYTGDEVDHQGTIGTSTVKKINGLNGEVVWKNEFTCESIIGSDAVNGGVLATNIVGKNNISDLVIFSLARYKGFNKGAIIAMSKSTGKIVWETDIDNYIWSSPVDFYDKNGNAYIIQCDSAGNVYLLNGKDGQVLNRITLDANIEASPAIFGDTIVIATRGGNIYGIEIK